jgi:hypothetical protein
MTKFNHKGTSHSQNHGRVTNRRQKHALSRRGLLRGIATAGGVIGAEGLLGLTGLNSDWQSLTQLAYAQELNGFDSTRDRYYIFCYFSGGWDILVGRPKRSCGL